MSFPTSIPSLPNPTSSNNLNNPDHAGLHVLENTEIEAIEAKLGIGASTPSGAALLIAGTNSSTAWGNLSGDVSSVGALTTLANTGVTPGTYTNANITVDSKGRLTLAATGSGGGGGSSGTVTAVTVANANGFNATVATPFTTPAITLSTTITGILKGNATAISAAIAADFPILNQSTTGTAANVTGTVAIANGGTGSATQNFVDLTTAQTVAGVKTFSSTITSNIATGTAPLTITSTTKVTNLNADQVDGFQASSTPTASTILPLDASATYPQSVIQTSTLGYAQITSTFSTTSTTAVQVTGLTATVTIPAGGRRVKITAYCDSVYSSAASFLSMYIYDGTIGTGTLIGRNTQQTVTANQQLLSMAMAIQSPAAGSKTYNIGFSTSLGTGSVFAGATFPAFILVELI